MTTEVTARADIKAVIKEPVFQEALKTQLPTNITPEKFTNTALAALSNNAELLKCDRPSLYDAIVKAAQQGLLPDGREGAIVPFKGKAQFMPMVLGIIKRLAESQIFIDAQVVAEHDHFEQEFGDNAAISHRPPKLGSDRGILVGVYAIARLPNGLVMREVMDKNQIDAVRASSRSGDNGPWAGFYGEMARKTVIRRLAKRLPVLDQRVLDAINAVDDEYDFGKAAEPALEPAKHIAIPAAAAKRPKALQAVVDATKAPVTHVVRDDQQDFPPAESYETESGDDDAVF